MHRGCEAPNPNANQSINLKLGNGPRNSTEIFSTVLRLQRELNDVISLSYMLDKEKKNVEKCTSIVTV